MIASNQTQSSPLETIPHIQSGLVWAQFRARCAEISGSSQALLRNAVGAYQGKFEASLAIDLQQGSVPEWRHAASTIAREFGQTAVRLVLARPAQAGELLTDWQFEYRLSRRHLATLAKPEGTWVGGELWLNRGEGVIGRVNESMLQHAWPRARRVRVERWSPTLEPLGFETERQGDDIVPGTREALSITMAFAAPRGPG